MTVIQAITAGKRVRAETSISSGAVSVSSAAAELCQMKLPSNNFSDSRVAIVGAGKMSRLLVKHLLSKASYTHQPQILCPSTLLIALQFRSLHMRGAMGNSYKWIPTSQ